MRYPLRRSSAVGRGLPSTFQCPATLVGNTRPSQVSKIKGNTYVHFARMSLPTNAPNKRTSRLPSSLQVRVGIYGSGAGGRTAYITRQWWPGLRPLRRRKQGVEPARAVPRRTTRHSFTVRVGDGEICCPLLSPCLVYDADWLRKVSSPTSTATRENS